MTQQAESATPRRNVRRKRLRRIGIGFLVLIGLLTVDYFAYPRFIGIGGRSFSSGGNGLWIRYTWYFGMKSETEISELIKGMTRRQIKYVYPHVRYIRKDGSLRYRYPDSGRRLVNRIHLRAPEVRVIAWIYAGNSRGAGEVDLSQSGVRARMVEEAIWLTKECGFDGVQWDYEICPDGDLNFLALMRETRAALPPGKILSTAVPMWLPWPLGRWGWSEDYFGKVARTCDQLVVMGYDSGFWLPRSYVWLMRQQTTRVTNAAHAANPDCRVLIGVPTYGKGFLSHNPHAENIRMALKGVREGVADSGVGRRSFAGVAVFADYTTQPDEWDTYEELWLGK